MNVVLEFLTDTLYHAPTCIIVCTLYHVVFNIWSQRSKRREENKIDKTYYDTDLPPPIEKRYPIGELYMRECYDHIYMIVRDEYHRIRIRNLNQNTNFSNFIPAIDLQLKDNSFRNYLTEKEFKKLANGIEFKKIKINNPWEIENT